MDTTLLSSSLPRTAEGQPTEADLQTTGDLLHQAIQQNLLIPDERLVVTPVHLQAAETRRIIQLSQQLIPLLYALPKRIFSGNLFEMARWCGFSETLAELFAHPANNSPSGQFARIDLYLTPDGPQVLEVNSGSANGGFHVDACFDLLDQHEPRASHLQQHHLERINTTQKWAAMVHRTLQAWSLTDAEIAIVDTHQCLEDDGLVYQAMGDGLARYSRAKPHLQALEDLHLRPDQPGLWAENRHIAVLYRLFTLSDVIEQKAGTAAVLQAWKDQQVRMPVDFTTSLYGNKCLLALCSDPRYRHHFTPEEGRMLDQVLPWTRILHQDLFPEALAKQQHLVVKPAHGFAGRQVVFGSDLAPAQWKEHLRDLLDSEEKYVLQEVVAPTVAPLTVWSQGNFWQADFQLLFSSYVLDGEFSGVLLRTTPVQQGKLVNYGLGGYIAPVYCTPDTESTQP